jgi:hypothetical protein
MAGLFQNMADAVVGQGDLRPRDMNVGTRGQPSVKPGRITDYGFHLKKFETEWKREAEAIRLLKQEG